MTVLKKEDLYSLEQYATLRTDFRTRVMAHKKNRQVRIGENATLYFEDKLTMQYQIQEMLRIEKIFEAEGIQEELDTYNPLIPDGKNWKATFMMEYTDVDQRKEMLAKLIGVEEKVWAMVEGFDRVYAIADEDLERDNEEKTSSVHFLRFEFTPAMVAAAKEGSALSVGIDHANYTESLSPLPESIRKSLVEDFG